MFSKLYSHLPEGLNDVLTSYWHFFLVVQEKMSWIITNEVLILWGLSIIFRMQSALFFPILIRKMLFFGNLSQSDRASPSLLQSSTNSPQLMFVNALKDSNFFSKMKNYCMSRRKKIKFWSQTGNFYKKPWKALFAKKVRQIRWVR